MAVLVEAISVIVKTSVIESKYPDGNESFLADVPNQTLCADGELARVGFMTPDDVGVFIDILEAKGLVHLNGSEAVDIVVADQQSGFTTPCSWAQVGRTAIDDEEEQIITACQLVDSKCDQLVCPDDWAYEGSLSHTYGWVPTEHADRSLIFLRKEGGMTVYLNTLTGKEVFTGRTHEKKT